MNQNIKQLVHTAVHGIENMDNMNLLFSIPGSKIIAIGPGGCIRILYFRARQLNALHRLSLCAISKSSYAAGTHRRQIKEHVEEILKSKELTGIILYISCADIMIQTDFEKMIQNMDNPKNIPVEIYKRGPMVKRFSPPKERIRQIINNIPVKVIRENKEDLCVLPPLVSDYTGALSLFPDSESGRFLYTGSGCANSIKSIDSFDKPDFAYSILNDMDVVIGVEKLVSSQAADYMKQLKKTTLIAAGTPVTAITGIDEKLFSKAFSKQNLNVDYITSDGFHSAADSLGSIILELGKRHIRRQDEFKQKKAKKRINIIGYSPFVFGKKEKLQEAVSILEDEGFQIFFTGYSTRKEFEQSAHAEFNWVLESSGIPMAQWMQTEFKIPYFYGIPFGISGFNNWISALGELTGNNNFIQYKLKIPKKNIIHRKIYLLEYGKEDDFFNALGTMLQEDFNCEVISIGLNNIKKSNWTTVQAVIGDPLLKPYLPAPFNETRFIPVPFPALSGNLFWNDEYEYTGKKGYDYLKKVLF